MAKKSTLFGGRVVKVENRSSFDKSHLNMLTTGVGTITPIVKQLLIPSSGKCKLPIHVELPPLATDAYLRSHLKVEAFATPLRLCYGGFQSWFCGEPVYDVDNDIYVRARLPRGFVVKSAVTQAEESDSYYETDFDKAFGVGSLTDYFNVRFAYDSSKNIQIPAYETGLQYNGGTYNGIALNLFPYICYHLIHDHYYRNKSVSKPAFMPVSQGARGNSLDGSIASHLPYMTCKSIIDVLLGSDLSFDDGTVTGIGATIGDLVGSPYLDNLSKDSLLNGFHLWQLRQRNFGDDYFTAAKPSAQAGSPVTVQVDANGKFTIASIRLQNALQEFAENQNYASPDYIQTLSARYGANLSAGIAQKPILLASADYPIFTKSVELNSQTAGDTTAYGTVRNPFSNIGIVGSKSGVASGNGTFEFEFNVQEPCYLMVMATLVPEANYATGIAHDMRIFIADGSLVDLPTSLLEHVGDEPVMTTELTAASGVTKDDVFGFVQRYLWHKAGEPNQIHGLFRKGHSLQAFAPQRDFSSGETISTDFLEVPKSALDDVAAVDALVSDYGVMLDCAVELFVSEPLSESALPALVNPASEHGRSVYLKNGGSKLS